MELCKKELGAGNETYFWYEDWSGNGILKDIFPDLFQLESRKMCLVRDRYQMNGGTLEWVNLGMEENDIIGFRENRTIMLQVNAPISEYHQCSGQLAMVGGQLGELCCWLP
ncbi:hypothetical protein LXL04_001008 [Taraxacum kok-saghyz]